MHTAVINGLSHWILNILMLMLSVEISFIKDIHRFYLKPNIPVVFSFKLAVVRNPEVKVSDAMDELSPDGAILTQDEIIP